MMIMLTSDFSEDLLLGVRNLSSWEVFFGLHDLADEKNTRVQKRFIKNVYSYPYYNLTQEALYWDIALVQLNEPVQYNRFTSPICLDESDDFYEEGQTIVTGWGLTKPDSKGSQFPHTGTLKVMTQESCNTSMNQLPEDSFFRQAYTYVHPGVLCTMGDTQDACQGDSGGPLMSEVRGRWYQVGVVALGDGCRKSGNPGINTRVTYYKSWINQTIALAEMSV